VLCFDSVSLLPAERICPDAASTADSNVGAYSAKRIAPDAASSSMGGDSSTDSLLDLKLGEDSSDDELRREAAFSIALRLVSPLRAATRERPSALAVGARCQRRSWVAQEPPLVRRPAETGASRVLLLRAVALSEVLPRPMLHAEGDEGRAVDCSVLGVAAAEATSARGALSAIASAALISAPAAASSCVASPASVAAAVSAACRREIGLFGGSRDVLRQA